MHAAYHILSFYTKILFFSCNWVMFQGKFFNNNTDIKNQYMSIYCILLLFTLYWKALKAKRKMQFLYEFFLFIYFFFFLSLDSIFISATNKLLLIFFFQSEQKQKQNKNTNICKQKPGSNLTYWIRSYFVYMGKLYHAICWK